MKILHVTSDWKWTGPAEPMLHAVCGLVDRGHRVDLAAPEAPPDYAGGLLERARARGVEPVYVLERGRGYRLLRDRDEVRRLRALVEREQYAVVHAHHTRDHLLCRAALRGLPVRLVASWHHGDPIPQRFWTRWQYGPGGCDGLTVLSDRLAERTRGELGGPGDRVEVLPGVVDTQFFAPRAAPSKLAAELGISADLRVLGIVARLQPHRRFDLLLQSVAGLRAEFPRFRLLVVGRGTRAKQVLEEPIERLGLGEVVIRAGYRRSDYRDVLALMQGLIFLVPGSDGSCRAVLEAMAMEIPVIVSRRGVLPETVADRKTGRVIEEKPESLIEALREFCREPDRWCELGRNARESALAGHRLDQHAARLERFYARLTQGSS